MKKKYNQILKRFEIDCPCGVIVRADREYGSGLISNDKGGLIIIYTCQSCGQRYSEKPTKVIKLK